MDEFKFTNRSALHGKIIEKFKTIQAFADAFGCSYTNMLNLLNGKTAWTIDGARKATLLLGIKNDASEIKRVFFCFDD